MSRRRVPPPPGWDARPVEGEGPFLGKWEGHIKRMARRVRVPVRLGMDREDVIADLSEKLIQFVRKHAWAAGELPSGALVATVIHRRVCVLNRDSRVPARVADKMPMVDDEPLRVELIEDEGIVEVDDELAEGEHSAVVAELVAALKAKLEAKDFNLLMLRFGMELSPTDIARATSVKDGRTISNRLLRSKAAARQYLQELGLWTWEDVGEP